MEDNEGWCIDEYLGYRSAHFRYLSVVAYWPFSTSVRFKMFFFSFRIRNAKMIMLADWCNATIGLGLELEWEKSERCT